MPYPPDFTTTPGTRPRCTARSRGDQCTLPDNHRGGHRVPNHTGGVRSWSRPQANADQY